MVAICTGVFHTPALMLMPCSLEFVPGFTLAEWSILPLILNPAVLVPLCMLLVVGLMPFQV
jgi:hypothetical protein